MVTSTTMMHFWIVAFPIFVLFPLIKIVAVIIAASKLWSAFDE